MQNVSVLARASFDAKLKTYIILNGTIALIGSIVGIVFLPLWALMGPWYARKTIAHLDCVLTERALIVKKGFLIRRERTIPLDKIQDLALKEGPLLRRLGLSTLRIETAGQNNASGGEADLTGLVDVYGFRDRVLEQRDRLVEGAGREASGDKTLGGTSTQDLLTAIRDSLARIETHLGA